MKEYKVEFTGTISGILSLEETPIPPPTPTWAEEFEGDSLDLEKWTVKSNIKMDVVKNSILHSKNEVIGGKSTSGWIISKDYFFDKYGRVEIKAKYSNKSGINNQIWINGGKNTPSSPYEYEYDFEYVPPTNVYDRECKSIISGHQGWSLHAMYKEKDTGKEHWIGEFINPTQNMNDWHIIDFIWKKDYFALKVDGQELKRVTGNYVPKAPMHIHINCCGQHPGCGCTVGDGILKMEGIEPTEMLIDHIRFYSDPTT